MRTLMLLAFVLFIGFAAAELLPLPEDWWPKSTPSAAPVKPVPVQVEPDEPEVKPERPYESTRRNWMG